MIELHLLYTDSRKAKLVIESWPGVLSKFVKVMPIDYKRVLVERKAAAAKKNSREKDSGTHG